MGDLRNKAKKLDEQAVRAAAEDRRKNGWTVFCFTFDPKRTRRDMTLGEAIRHLLRVTNTRIRWHRCPVRGLAIHYQRLPKTSYAHDSGETYMRLNFSNLPDEVEAKKVLALDMLLTGVDEWRGLPNRVFDEQVALLRWLLTAPPSVSADDWLEQKNRLHRQTQPLLRTHEAELRLNLLGERYTARPDCPVVLTAKARMEALGREV